MSRTFEVKKSVLRELTANHALAASASDHAAASAMACFPTNTPCHPTVAPGQPID